MRSFFKIVFGSMVGFILASILFSLISVAIIIGLVKGIGEDDKVEVVDNSVLRLNLNYDIDDRTTKFPDTELDLLNMRFDEKLGLNDILDLIGKAKYDERIKGIYLELDMGGPDFAVIEEIRDALIDFKTTGKFVIAYGEFIGQKMYYLASVSDEIYGNPAGIMEFKGLAYQMLFFKKTLEKLGVEMQIFYAGKYKSATEPLRATEMSEANREQITKYLSYQYSHFLNNIGGARNLAPEFLDSIASNLVVTNIPAAFENKLIDGVLFEDEVLDILKEKSLGKEKEDKKEDKKEKERKLKMINLEKYAKGDFDDVEIEGEEKDYDNKIAVVYAEGDIIDGKGKTGSVGSEDYAALIRKLRKNDDVKAIVLRINSPGGSAIASDVIAREVALAKQAKPVIVSMGNVAASGGYYIAAPADLIIAQPNTITGSIGVFGIVPNMKNLFEDKLGITSDVVKTGKHSDLFNVLRPLNEDEKIIIQKEVNKVYVDFISQVAKGRNMDTARVGDIAQGRVYSGLEAKELGLVDQLGGLNDAIKLAAEKAELKGWYISEYPGQKNFLERIFNTLNDDIESRYLESQLGDYYQYFKQLNNMMNGHRVQMRLPYEVKMY